MMEDLLKNVSEAELALLKSDDLTSYAGVTPFLEHLQRGEFGLIIESERVKEIFSVPHDLAYQTDKPLEYLRNLVNIYLNKHDNVLDHFEVLCIGIAGINAFIQSNWTGPDYKISKNSEYLLEQSLSKCISNISNCQSEFSKSLRFVLSEDGENICDSIVNSELLIIALVTFGSHLSELKTPDWWLLRSTYIHQQILDEHSFTLLEQLNTLSNRVLGLSWVVNDKYLQVLSHLEIARIYLHFGKIASADKEIKSAISLQKMDVQMTGSLGKRTYFQTREIAQLMLNVKVDRDKEIKIDNIESNEIDFLKDVVLNDEIRMPSIAFSNQQDGRFPDLLPLEQATLLAMLVLKKKNQARDHLQNEELMPFLNCLLAHPKVWSFQLSVLHLRTRLESDHKRTIERALLQTQSLMELNNNKTPISKRLSFFYCSYAPPTFVIASECASILVSIGSIQSALDLYLQLQMWDEVIACYNFLKLRHKAAEVIREQIKKGGETVKLLCFLGDATDDISCYEKAWELSNHRSAQAQRHWGMFYFNKKMYKESIEHFNLSLSKSSLQIALWFRLGYANLVEHKWEESASAYRRYCTLEPGSFEAWNNMAKAYILLGQKKRAYYALQEAIKCNFETWQVWDNLMAVSSDCGEFEEVINCYHSILDLKDKHIDEQVLGVLTSVIVNNVKDSRGQPASALRKKALELFGRITSKVMSNPTIWQLYAQLTASIDDQTSITQSKVVQYYQKAYTVATQDNSWCKNFESIHQVLNICKKLVEAHLIFSKNSSSHEATQSLTSVKFVLVNVLAKVNEQLLNLDKSNLNESFLSDVSSLENALDHVQSELLRVKNL